MYKYFYNSWHLQCEPQKSCFLKITLFGSYTVMAWNSRFINIYDIIC